jgi:hypothetical protein
MESAMPTIEATTDFRAPAAMTAPTSPNALSAIAYQTTAIVAALAIPTFTAVLFDDRQLNGVSVWDKPLKFEAALVVHLVTLGLMATLFTVEAGRQRLVRWAYQITAFASVAEIAYIVLQAARGRASHFNSATELEFVLYLAMGVGAVSLVVAASAIGYALLNGAKPSIGHGLHTGSAWGLMLGGVATLLVAGVLSSGLIGGPGHWVGGIHSDAAGLPLTGWSTTGGDLRVPHFFATHMMQALPLLGLFADRFFPRHATTVVGAGALTLVGLVVLTFAEAVAGVPFVRA